MFPSYRNQSVDAHSSSVDWFLYDEDVGRKTISCYWSLSIPPENNTKSEVIKLGIEGDHCVKIVQIRSFFWSVFSCIRIEYGDLHSKSAWKVSKNEVFSGSHFPVFGLNTEIYYGVFSDLYFPVFSSNTRK